MEPSDFRMLFYFLHFNTKFTIHEKYCHKLLCPSCKTLHSKWAVRCNSSTQVSISLPRTNRLRAITVRYTPLPHSIHSATAAMDYKNRKGNKNPVDRGHHSRMESVPPADPTDTRDQSRKGVKSLLNFTDIGANCLWRDLKNFQVHRWWSQCLRGMAGPMRIVESVVSQEETEQ